MDRAKANHPERSEGTQRLFAGAQSDTSLDIAQGDGLVAEVAPAAADVVPDAGNDVAVFGMTWLCAE
jgi:hypothetical protein